MSSPQYSWTVVEFIESKSVEAVPTKWLESDNQCFWPPMTEKKLMVVIKNGESPNPNWPLYQVRIFKDSTFGEYGTARRKAKKAEETSDLNSDADLPLKRKIRKRKLFESDSDSSDQAEEESSLPTPPKLSLKNMSSKSQDISNPPKKLSLNFDSKKLPKMQDVRTKNVYFEPSRTSKKFCSQDSQKNIPSTSKMADAAGSCMEGDISDENSIIETNQKTKPTGTCVGCQELHKKIDILAADSARRISSLKASLLQIREDIETLIQRPHKESSSLNVEQEFFTLFNFPLDNLESLEQVNQYLANDENKFEIAVKHMVKLGGKDTYDFIRRCFQETLSDSLARNFTFEGTKDKKSFKELKLGMVIIAASGLHNGADRKLTETAIRKWLRRANERHKSKLKLNMK